ncbi:hypothetical protein RND81_13G017900, partial [Saponaria officinalis]
TTCYLCGAAEETHFHLFFECVYSSRCIQVLENLIGVKLPVLQVWQTWTRERAGLLTKKHICGAVLVGLIYSVWEVRNMCRFDLSVVRPEYLVKNLVHTIQSSIKVRDINGCNRKVKEWFLNL